MRRGRSPWCVFDNPAADWRSGDALKAIYGDYGSVNDSRGWAQFSVFFLTLLADPDAQLQVTMSAATATAQGYTPRRFRPSWGLLPKLKGWLRGDPDTYRADAFDAPHGVTIGTTSTTVRAGDVADEWDRNWKARGYTHIALSRKYGYPGSPIEGRDFTIDRFVELVIEVLDRGFAPVLFLSDLPDEPILPTVQALKDAGLLPFVICVPSWEPIPTSYWRSRQLSDVLIGMKEIGGDAITIDVHLQPGRWSMASYAGTVVDNGQPLPPGTKVKERYFDDETGQWMLYLIEDDDPWEGDEQGCWKSHGGQHVDQFLYQLEHGFTQTTEPDWQNRWRDGVPRMGNGLNGWRIMPICLFEGVLYDSYRGHCDETRAREIAADAASIAWSEFGVQIPLFGNGAPPSTGKVGRTGQHAT